MYWKIYLALKIISKKEKCKLCVKQLASTKNNCSANSVFGKSIETNLQLQFNFFFDTKLPPKKKKKKPKYRLTLYKRMQRENFFFSPPFCTIFIFLTREWRDSVTLAHVFADASKKFALIDFAFSNPCS